MKVKLQFNLRLIANVFLFLKLYKHIIFSVGYKNTNLTKPGFQGIKDFFGVLFKGKIKRDPVSIKGFKKYLSFN